MNTEDEFDVFLAHHSGDKPLVRQISNKLKEHGVKPWIDEEQILPGKSFQTEIQQAIPKIKTAAIILGEMGVGRWQELENQVFISAFIEKSKTVIPVLLPGINEVPETLPFLRQLRWINFTTPDDATALRLLIWGITGRRPEEELKECLPSVTSTETIQPSSFEADTSFNQAKAQDVLKNCPSADEFNVTEKLADFLTRSRRVEHSARRAFCIKIGVEPEQLSFLEQSSDADFASELIAYLCDIGKMQVLRKISENLEDIFKGGKYESDLQKIKDWLKTQL